MKNDITSSFSNKNNNNKIRNQIDKNKLFSINVNTSDNKNITNNKNKNSLLYTDNSCYLHTINAIQSNNSSTLRDKKKSESKICQITVKNNRIVIPSMSKEAFSDNIMSKDYYNKNNINLTDITKENNPYININTNNLINNTISPNSNLVNQMDKFNLDTNNSANSNSSGNNTCNNKIMNMNSINNNNNLLLNEISNTNISNNNITNNEYLQIKSRCKITKIEKKNDTNINNLKNTKLINLNLNTNNENLISIVNNNKPMNTISNFLKTKLKTKTTNVSTYKGNLGNFNINKTNNKIKNNINNLRINFNNNNTKNIINDNNFNTINTNETNSRGNNSIEINRICQENSGDERIYINLLNKPYNTNNTNNNLNKGVKNFNNSYSNINNISSKNFNGFLQTPQKESNYNNNTNNQINKYNGSNTGGNCDAIPSLKQKLLANQHIAKKAPTKLFLNKNINEPSCLKNLSTINGNQNDNNKISYKIQKNDKKAILLNSVKNNSNFSNCNICNIKSGGNSNNNIPYTPDSSKYYNRMMNNSSNAEKDLTGRMTILSICEKNNKKKDKEIYGGVKINNNNPNTKSGAKSYSTMSWEYDNNNQHNSNQDSYKALNSPNSPIACNCGRLNFNFNNKNSLSNIYNNSFSYGKIIEKLSASSEEIKSDEKKIDMQEMNNNTNQNLFYSNKKNLNSTSNIKKEKVFNLKSQQIGLGRKKIIN